MTEHRGRTTQVLDRKDIPSSAQSGKVAEVRHLIQSGEEARRVFGVLVEAAADTPHVKGAALFLPAEQNNDQAELVASHGEILPLVTTSAEEPDKNLKLILQTLTHNHHRPTNDGVHTFDVICLGAAIGSLVVYTTAPLDRGAIDKMQELAHHASVVFERQRLSHTLQHFIDRLEVLNELNQLIASSVGLQRIAKGVARECAFRFAADLALAFVLDDEHKFLEPKGGYGCGPNVVPSFVDPKVGLLGQVMRVGGHLSAPVLHKYQDHGLDYLLPLNIIAIDACCLEVRGEALGVLLVGYRRENSLCANDLTRFEEFSQGAAVAIANARSQERITSYTERLEELVTQRTADLSVQTARAEEANNAKSQFLANMSHELRTPLTAIVGYSSVLADGIFGALNDKQREALLAVTRSSDHLKNLIDDVLNLARIESGKEQSEPTRVLVRDLLNQTQKLMQQTAIGKGVLLQPLQVPEEVMNATMFVDQKHIHQILINLMSNAVKYTPRGGNVWVSGALVGDKVKITVHDTGVGMSKSKLEKLFERFERGEDAYSKSQEGTGIGLNLTKRLMELNGGTIGVDSTEGKGTVFSIFLPLALAEPVKVAQPEVSETKVRLDGLTAVVVDDNRDTCNVISTVLSAAGASVKIAQSVAEGWELIAQAPPDIILTDLALPGVSGLVLIQNIRNHPGSLATIPIIVLSACAFESDRRAAVDAGANHFMAKPFKTTELIRSVRQVALASAIRGELGSAAVEQGELLSRGLAVPKVEAQ